MVIPVHIYDHRYGIGEVEALRFASATLLVQTSRDYTPPPNAVELILILLIKKSIILLELRKKREF